MKRLPSILALALSLAACGQSKTPATPGEAYYKALNCALCHQVGPEGGTGGPDLTFVGFRRSPPWLDAFLKDPQAWKASSPMPNPRLPDKARAAIVEYLATLKGQDYAASGRPWDSPRLKDDPVARGRVIYGRIGCAACHGDAGSGGQPNNNVPGNAIPGLSSLAEKFTRGELEKKILRGVIPEKADPRGPEPLAAMPPWGQVLNDAELAALVDYLLTLKSKSGDEAGF